MKKLVLVDDHAIVRHGMKTAFESCGYLVVASVSSCSQGRSAIAALVPDAVIIDINLPDATGFDLVKWIRSIDSEMPIVIVSLHDSDEYVRAARKCGANAYIFKSSPVEEIVAAVNFAFQSPGSFTCKSHTSEYELKFTAREFDVLSLIEKGFSNQEISAELHISISTVKTYISSIFQKLSVKNRSSAVKIAKDSGLLI